MTTTQTNDFSKGSVAGNILRLAVPMTVAQLINVLYSVVDRMYIGRLPDASGNALTGLGLTFPIISIVTAFANLFGMGGSPLFSIERGRGNLEKARVIMGNTFALLVGTGVVLTAVILLIKQPLLYAFGASDATYPYANGYITIYLCGSVFVMISLGMNNFINAQGFGRKGMMTVLLGAVTNIVLDPIFIFLLDMGVQGAALATIIAQFFSTGWAAVALGRSKQAVFFSLFRKVVIVAPLTLLLPHLFGLGVTGVFLAEPISNFIGGAACYITMLLTIWREMRRKEKAPLTEQT